MRGIYCTKRRQESDIYVCQYNGIEASVAAEILRTGGEQTVITQYWCYVTDETGSQYGVCITQLLFFLQNTEKHSSSIIKLECQSLVAARSKAWVCGARLLGL